jgi:hypothetical protein
VSVHQICATFLSGIITGEESWIYGYDPETKQQSSQSQSPNSLRKKCEIGEKQLEVHAICSQRIRLDRPNSQFRLLL